jgi:hypothetical protein
MRRTRLYPLNPGVIEGLVALGLECGLELPDARMTSYGG